MEAPIVISDPNLYITLALGCKAPKLGAVRTVRSYLLMPLCLFLYRMAQRKGSLPYRHLLETVTLNQALVIRAAFS